MATTDERRAESAPAAAYDPHALHRDADGQRQRTAFVLRYASLEIDVPRSLGYFGGLGVAVALEVIDPPLALFIAAVPFVKMLDLPRMLTPVRFVSHVVQGAAKPVGSDADGVVRVSGDDQ